MGQAQLRNLEDYTHFRRLMLSGDLPTSDGMTVPTDAAADTGDLGSVVSMGYHYTDAASFGASGTDQFIATSLANTHFIHGAFESNATSGTARGQYMILNLKGAGQSGECIRARTFVCAAAGGGTTVNGAHIECRINGATTTGGVGSITGDANAIRATMSVDSGAGTTGTIAAIELESNNGQAVTGFTAASFIRLHDYNTSYAMPLFMDLTGITTTAVSGATQALVTGTCSSLGHGLRVKMPDGSIAYIPICTSCS